MKSLFNTIMGNSNSITEPEPEQFVFVNCSDNNIINQIHRKIKLLNDFKKYIETADETTIYYKYIINTKIYDSDNDTHIVSMGLFGGLYENRLTSNTEQFLSLLMDI